MLKIRVDNQPEATTLYVEGKLVGDCVDELRRVWTSLRTESPTKPTIVELSSVRVVDVTGRKLLSQMHEWGSQLAGSGLVIGSLINEIRGARNQSAQSRPG
jgi:hypothetical protein